MGPQTDFTEGYLDWDLKRPCADCPFRKSSPFHEGVAERALDLANKINDHCFAHTCHKTDPRADSDEGKRWTGRPKHCVGSLFMLIKSGDGADLQLPLLRAVETGKVDIHELSRKAHADTDCFTLSEFMAYCGSGLRMLWQEKLEAIVEEAVGK